MLAQKWLHRKPSLGSLVNPSCPLANYIEASYLYNEGAGGFAYNAAPKSYPLTLGAGYTFGTSGSSAGLNCAAASTAKCTHTAIATGTTFTIIMRVWFRTFVGAYGVLWNSDTGNGLYIRSTGKLSYYFGSDHLSATALSTLTTNHIVLSVAAGAGTYIINGAIDANTVASVTSQALSVIGSDGASERIDSVIVQQEICLGYAFSQADAINHMLNPYGHILAPSGRNMWASAAPVVTVAAPYFSMVSNPILVPTRRGVVPV